MKIKKPKISTKKVHQNDGGSTGSLNYFRLFRFATKWDLFVILIGIILTIVKSFVMPFFIVIYGEFTTLLVDRTLGVGASTPAYFLPIFGGGKILVDASVEENRAEIKNDSIAYGILMTIGSVVHLIAGIFCVDCFNHTALRQITRIRIKYFQSLMRQEIGWYDVADGNDNFAVRITEDIEKIRDGIAEKVSHFLSLIIGFVICFIMSFIYGWKLSLVIVSYVPIVSITSAVIGKLQASCTTKETNSYSAAANVAEEVLSGIRTVFAFGGERVEIDRYNNRLVNAKDAARRKGFLSGLGDGIMRFLFFGSMSLAFWYGVKLVLDDRDKEDKEYTPAVLMITTFSLITGADNLALTAPFLETFASACGSAASIFRVIDRASKIDSMSNQGKEWNSNIQGNIQFKNVKFSYPSRPEVQILSGLELEVQAGQQVALVGSSGNGKSTCLQLLQRFYDPNDGQVLIDGCDIRSLNINALRSSIATVGQEPILFSTTIGDNIRYGNPDATDKDVVAAAKNSGVHDFIAKLPQGYNTLVGEKGSQLSGGQKQRIAIARALIQNPKILLLDEATSALDYQSEKFVQETLDRVSKGRTTIVVSHRLSAIRDADRILFIEKGQVVEDGTHTELLALKGRYFEMITAGGMEDESEDESIDDQVEMNQGDLATIRPKVELKRLVSEQKDVQKFFRGLSTGKVDSESKPSAENVQYWRVFKRVLTLAKPEWLIMSVATVSAVIIGASLPLFAILFGEVYGALSLQDEKAAYDQVFFCCMIFLSTGIIIFISALAQTYWFAKASVNLTTKVRAMTFAALMRQECGWFDDEKHTSGALSARLTGDAASLQSAIGFPLSMLLQSISTFIISIIVSFTVSVKFALGCSIAIPLSLVAVFLEAKHMAKAALVEKQATEKGTKIASEAITNIRTVASLRQEKYMIERYVAEMKKVEVIIRKKIVWRGLTNSLAQSIPFFGYAAALCYGGFLVANGEMHFKSVIKVTEALLYGTIVIGQTLVYIPSFTAAFVGAHRIFQIVDREPLISSPNVSNKSRKPDKNHNIEYKKIDFRYPTRSDVQILRDFNLNVAEGKTIALVGSSGCGKSTVIQLLQRLYDPEHGRIFIGLDEVSSDIPLGGLRSKLSIVSQEPVLFEKTIYENIAYGDNSREVSMEEVIAAAKVANVHNFIVQLPLGYETNVGSKSAQLSGGQKQRIAIARALIRNPKILLLDEATSALDLHSEQVVQQALETAQSGRTCLVIAHRLSTIQNADAICVLRSGSIVEYGTHNELLALGGLYTRLYNAQK